MGCGSSRSTVAIVETPPVDKPNEKTESKSLDHFVVEQPKDKIIPQNITKSSNSIKTEKSNETLKDSSSCDSLNSIRDSKHVINRSIKSLRDDNKREKSASSTTSKDSGVCDENFERKDSIKSQASVNSKPPSAGKRSSARKKLLRIDDNTIEAEESNKQPEPFGVSMISRPKSRFGNVAFDLVLDTPETGNMKKRPEKLALIQKKKKPKRIKTKEEIDQKIKAANERRMIQETEKQIKAKQFQHLSIHTTVQPFQAPPDDDDDNNESVDINNNSSYNNLIDTIEELPPTGENGLVSS